jgi:peptidase E
LLIIIFEQIKTMKNLLIASTSTLFGEEYLAYLLPQLEIHFQNCGTILFIPFAQPSGMSYDDYTKKVSVAFAKINKKVVGIHQSRAEDEARTRDNQLGRLELYQLSYFRIRHPVLVQI